MAETKTPDQLILAVASSGGCIQLMCELRALTFQVHWPAPLTSLRLRKLHISLVLVVQQVTPFVVGAYC